MISVDLLEERNGKDHHTDQYEVEQLVLRKGQAFHLDVEFDHPYDASTDTIWLEMLMGRSLTSFTPSVLEWPSP